MRAFAKAQRGRLAAHHPRPDLEMASMQLVCLDEPLIHERSEHFRQLARRRVRHLDAHALAPKQRLPHPAGQNFSRSARRR
jgi:hypothetical protein